MVNKNTKIIAEKGMSLFALIQIYKIRLSAFDNQMNNINNIQIQQKKTTDKLTIIYLFIFYILYKLETPISVTLILVECTTGCYNENFYIHNMLIKICIQIEEKLTAYKVQNLNTHPNKKTRRFFFLFHQCKKLSSEDIFFNQY